MTKMTRLDGVRLVPELLRVLEVQIDQELCVHSPAHDPALRRASLPRHQGHSPRDPSHRDHSPHGHSHHDRSLHNLPGRSKHPNTDTKEIDCVLRSQDFMTLRGLVMKFFMSSSIKLPRVALWSELRAFVGDDIVAGEASARSISSATPKSRPSSAMR